MDFIERWLHLSPDNGNGSTEAMFVAVAAIFVIAIFNRRRLLSYARRRGTRTK